MSAQRFGERFEREARVISSLNHPNICTLHDVGDHYLVMELVEGQTLAQRIRKHPMPRPEALALAKQIAAALEAAHEKGIIHRDLKPGNVIVKDDLSVKVLDFGLAKFSPTSQPQSAEDSTRLMTLTETGTILGTAAYMSPEQASGKPVDHRSDIWAFGVVLYEMLTGARPFEGDSAQEMLASIIAREPDLGKVPADLRPLLEKCLRKDPRKRWQSIGDVRLAIEEEPERPAPEESRIAWAPWVVAGLAVIGFAAFYFNGASRDAATAKALHFQMELPQQTVEFTAVLALSPNGERLAFTASEPDGVSRVWVREIGGLEARVLPGTEGARGLFWSPDSQSIGFSSGSDLKKVAVIGGLPTTVVTLDGASGTGTWNDDGVILFGQRVQGDAGNIGINRVGADGVVTTLTELDPERGEVFHAFPYFLPDGNHFLYLSFGGESGIYYASLDTRPGDPPSERLVAGGSGLMYVPSETNSAGGWLLYRDRSGTLLAQPFDADRLRLEGDPIPVAQDVGGTGSTPFFSASLNGTLVYQPRAEVQRRLIWLDRQGVMLSSVSDLSTYRSVELSPDGTKVATTLTPQSVWLREFPTGANFRFAIGVGQSNSPIWAPDGQRVAYCAGVGANNLVLQSSTDLGDPKLLMEGRPLSPVCPQDWSSDGRFLLLHEGESGDLYVLPMDGSDTAADPFPLLETPNSEDQARFSPDGRWVVYRSNASGTPEIYVVPISEDGRAGSGKRVISNGGGHQPRWSSDGKEIFYISQDGELMSVNVSAEGGAFQAGAPNPLFAVNVYPGPRGGPPRHGTSPTMANASFS